MNNQLISNIDPIIQSHIFQIVKEIKLNKDYSAGAKILLDNNISFREVFNYTLKLNIFDCARLADAAKKIKMNE